MAKYDDALAAEIIKTLKGTEDEVEVAGEKPTPEEIKEIKKAMKKHNEQLYKQLKRKYAFVQFHRIKGLDLDKEVDEFVQGTDLVKLIKNLETNYQYIQNFLMVTSIFVIFAYSVMIQKPFDHAVI